MTFTGSFPLGATVATWLKFTRTSWPPAVVTIRHVVSVSRLNDSIEDYRVENAPGTGCASFVPLGYAEPCAMVHILFRLARLTA